MLRWTPAKLVVGCDRPARALPRSVAKSLNDDSTYEFGLFPEPQRRMQSATLRLWHALAWTAAPTVLRGSEQGAIAQQKWGYGGS